jgi:hypothetical protein
MSKLQVLVMSDAASVLIISRGRTMTASVTNQLWQLWERAERVATVPLNKVNVDGGRRSLFG